MGRRAHHQTLHLWANGDYVGRWTVKASGDSELQYDAAWRNSTRGRPVSLSLPFNLQNEPLKGGRVSHYFDGLLPDSDTIRKRVAVRFKTGSSDAFELLSAVGRDCAGALQLLPEGVEPEGPGQVDGIVVDDEAIERHLLDMVNPGHDGAMPDPHDDFRISLAGAQEKDAFLRWNGKWLKPRGATPTTHIFKLPIGVGWREKGGLLHIGRQRVAMPAAVQGIRIANSECGDCDIRLTTGARRRALRPCPVARWKTAQRFRMTPVYDVMSAYPAIGNGPNQWAERDIRMAMALFGKNRHYLAHNIMRRHFNSTAKKVGYGNDAEPLIQDFIARTPAIVDKVRAELPAGFPEKVADRILGGIRAAAHSLEHHAPGNPSSTR